MPSGVTWFVHDAELAVRLFLTEFGVDGKDGRRGKGGMRGSDNKDAYEHFMKLHTIMKDGVGVPEDKAEYTVGPWLTFDADKEIHTGAHAAAANALLKDYNRPGFTVPRASKV